MFYSYQRSEFENPPSSLAAVAAVAPCEQKVAAERPASPFRSLWSGSGVLTGPRFCPVPLRMTGLSGFSRFYEDRRETDAEPSRNRAVLDPLQSRLLQVVEIGHPGAGGPGERGPVLTRFDAQLFRGELGPLHSLQGGHVPAGLDLSR